MCHCNWQLLWNWTEKFLCLCNLKYLCVIVIDSFCEIGLKTFLCLCNWKHLCVIVIDNLPNLWHPCPPTQAGWAGFPWGKSQFLFKLQVKRYLISIQYHSQLTCFTGQQIFSINILSLTCYFFQAKKTNLLWSHSRGRK